MLYACYETAEELDLKRKIRARAACRRSTAARR